MGLFVLREEIFIRNLVKNILVFLLILTSFTIHTIPAFATSKEVFYTFYPMSLDDMLNIQMSLSHPPQTDLYGGGWKSAQKNDVRYYLNPNNFRLEHVVKNTITVNTSTLNVRTGPGTNYERITQVVMGQVFNYVDFIDNWYKIDFGTRTGWVHGGYVIENTQNNNEVPSHLFQFLILSGNAGVNITDLNKVLLNKGILEGRGKAFIDASLIHNINEVYLVSHALLETGNGASRLANGILVAEFEDGKLVTELDGELIEGLEYKKVYNMFGIGAHDIDPIRLGAEYAFRAGWLTPEASIVGGAKFIGDRYINHPTYKQDTLYKMRWNPGNPGTHQYATDVGWAVKQVTRIKQIYDQLNNYVLRFDIPKYIGFMKSGDDWLYVGNDGNFRKGWVQDKLNWYFFDKSGVMRQGWIKDANQWYYLGKDGAMKNSWQLIDSKWYYLGKDGAMRTGWIELAGNKYFLGNDGAMKTGWLDINGNKYYLGQDGVMRTGWIELVGNKYFLGNDGAMKTGWLEMNENKYYLGQDGAMRTGWIEIAGSKYYFDKSGIMQTRWTEVDGSKYYFGLDGKMQIGWIEIEGNRYYLSESGATLKNWQKIDGKWYRFDQNGKVLIGWQHINNKWYLLSSRGAMLTDWQQYGGKWYLLGSDGAMLSGWQQYSGKWYLLGSDGAMLTGWQKSGGKWYYLYSNGAMKTGWHNEQDNWYYLLDDGAMNTGWRYLNGIWYYFNSSGTMATGWRMISNKWYFFYENGRMASNTVIAGYRLGADGSMY